METKQQKWARYMRNYRAKYPEKVKIARKLQYNTRKIRAMGMVGEVKCRRCGCDELEFLEFNHINGNGCKEWRETNGAYIADRLLSKKRDTNGLEILCRVCNALDYLLRKNEKQATKFNIKWK